MSTLTTTPYTLVMWEDYSTKLQEELDEPTKWKDICNVEYVNTYVLHNPYLTDMTVQTGYRGTAYTMQAIVQTDEYTTISNYYVAPQVIDRANLAQCSYLNLMEIAKRQGILLNEKIESAVYADYGNMTTFDNASIGGSAGNITVSTNNIDQIITGMIREINEASGQSLLARNGAFIVWRPADFELLTQYAMANGFATADQALKNGLNGGFDYMGVTHYTSNLLTSGHVVGGVKKVYHLGILKDTYGQVMINDKDPGNISGVSVVSRVDFAGKVWAKVAGVLFNITVA